jgi:hypothetical protein
MDLYNHIDWIKFRDEVIRLDNDKCTRCLRSRSDGVVLQVHHKVYERGKKPWEYAYVDCETLCKGCHAQDHGKVMPQSGWEVVGYDDLGELSEYCELCGTELRHVYLVDHLRWRPMTVGTDCCDKLTTTNEASDFARTNQRRKRFVTSPRWQALPSGDFAISQKGVSVRVSLDDGKYCISMNGMTGKPKYADLLSAKIRVFNFIESGEAQKFFSQRQS